MTNATTGTCKTLLVIDRSSGEIERISEHDGNFHASIASAANICGMTLETAMRILDDGQELVTAGFIRRLAS